MPIPQFTDDGYLPDHIHECTVEELDRVFGRFQSSDRRINLTKKLKDFIHELRRAGIGIELIIDGSYVTQKDDPEDIDLILALREEFDFSGQIIPAEYNLISNRAVKRKYGFDIFVDKKETERYKSRIAFFQKVREMPGMTKGLLRISL